MPPINLFTPPRGIFDPAAGIPIATLARCGPLIFNLSEIPPGGGVSAHVHQQGSEIYLIVDGSGHLYTQAPDKRRLSTPLCTGDLLCVPAGHVHQLINTGSRPLRLLFACPDSHLGQDRIVLPDLQASAP
jgi:mannose-6-phosphate isomerase-like protein (cupin superfamily)